MRTFNCEAALVVEQDGGVACVRAHRGLGPRELELRELAAALEGARDRAWLGVGTASASGESPTGLSLQGRPLSGLLAVATGASTAGATRWLVVAVTQRKQAFFDPLQAQQVLGLQLFARQVEALREMHDSRAQAADKAAALDRANAELARRFEAEREAAARQERMRRQLADAQRLESIGRLAGGVAHDFNNLLMVINGNAEMVLDEDVSEDVALLVSGIAEAGARASALTQQLLAYSRRQVIRPVEVDANGLVERAMWLYERLVGDDIELVFRPAPGGARVCADAQQFDQLLGNLVVNARDAIRAHPGGAVGRRITVSLRVSARDAALSPLAPAMLVEVADDGCGMDEDTVSRAFEPFFTTKAVGEGTGLGLATAQGVVRQNGGVITVDSVVGRGSRFTVHWPLAGTPPLEAGADGAPASPSPVVLLVEDDANVRRFMARGLTRSGCVVHDFESGVDAIASLGRGDLVPDALVTDVVMPDLNGREVADAVLERIPALPVLFVSGYTADIIARKGVLGDGIELLEKPFGAKVLADRVWRLLGQRPPPARAREAVGARSAASG